jgi:hypothetical protein
MMMPMSRMSYLRQILLSISVCLLLNKAIYPVLPQWVNSINFCQLYLQRVALPVRACCWVNAQSFRHFFQPIPNPLSNHSQSVSGLFQVSLCEEHWWKQIQSLRLMSFNDCHGQPHSFGSSAFILQLEIQTLIVLLHTTDLIPVNSFNIHWTFMIDWIITNRRHFCVLRVRSIHLSLRFPLTR